jgi:hypothetical protein
MSTGQFMCIGNVSMNLEGVYCICYSMWMILYYYVSCFLPILLIHIVFFPDINKNQTKTNKIVINMNVCSGISYNS